MEYQLELPPSLSGIHDMFLVSHLRKYVTDSLQPILLDAVEVVVDLSIQPQLSHVVDYAIKMLRNKEIPLVKLL